MMKPKGPTFVRCWVNLRLYQKSYIMNNYYDLLNSEELYKAIYVSSKPLSFFFQAALLLKTHAICGKGT